MATPAPSRDSGRADLGLIGLAVMGQNLALNMADHGFRVAVYNRTTDTMRQFVADHPGTPGGLVGCEALDGLARAIARPRKVVVLVKAGPPVDDLIGHLAPFLARGDILVDGGNSLWTDTIRREKALLNLLRSGPVTRPEIQRRVVGQRRVVLPAAWSRSAFSASSSSLPARTSRSIWRSQGAQSNSKNQARTCASSSGESG